MSDLNQVSGNGAVQPDWFDRVIVVAANIKVLVLGPLMAAAMAYGICFLVPQRYASLAIVALPPQPLPTASQPLPTPQSPTQAAAMMVSPLVLDPILVSLNPSGPPVHERERLKLAERIKATVGKDMLLRLEVTAQTPVQAQEIAKAVIDGWRKTTVPGEKDRKDLEKRLDHMTASLSAVTTMLERLTAEGVGALNKPLTRAEGSSGLVGLGELQARYLTEVLAIPRAIQGFSMDVVVQPPTLPFEPVWPKKWLVSGLAGVVALLVLLAWFFGVQGWVKYLQKPENTEKLNNLRQAMQIGPRAG